MSADAPTTQAREKPLPEGVLPIARAGLGANFTAGEAGELTVHDLAWYHNNPDSASREVIDCACSVCGCALRSMRLFSQITACDPCREKAQEDERMNACKSFWEAACPRDLRATDPEYPGDESRGIPPFPTAIYLDLRATWTFNESLFLYGPSGSGKTKTAALLLKRALLRGKDIGFFWPEELKDAAQSRDRLKILRSLAARDILLMDDAVLTGAQDEKVSSFLKDLIDMLMREQHHFIITSQIGGEDYNEQADKFGNLTKADKERIAALWRRIKEKCRVVPFAQAKPAAGETTF